MKLSHSCLVLTAEFRKLLKGICGLSLDSVLFVHTLHVLPHFCLLNIEEKDIYSFVGE